MSKVTVWTDGSCPENGRPGITPGGWAFYSKDEHGAERSAAGHLRDTTNNRAELTAAIRGLTACRPEDCITLVTDSRYVQLAVLGMKRPTTNRDLLIDLAALLRKRNITCVQLVKGHADEEMNNLVDMLAGEAAR